VLAFPADKQSSVQMRLSPHVRPVTMILIVEQCRLTYVCAGFESEPGRHF
jgi:hypothetical protein